MQNCYAIAEYSARAKKPKMLSDIWQDCLGLLICRNSIQSASSLGYLLLQYLLTITEEEEEMTY